MHALALILAFALSGDEPLLPGGGFPDWDDGAPVGWTVSVGATSPGEKDSEIAPGPEGGILLRGDAATARWKSISRDLELEPGHCYRLSFEARGLVLVRQGKQFDNAFVGVELDPRGKDSEYRVVSIERGGWTFDEVIFEAPASGRASVILFLSKTGTMEARALVLERLRPEDSFEILVRHMGRYYSHFASKGIDPEAWAAKHRAKVAAAADQRAWIEAVKGMLAELQDIHVWIHDPIARTNEYPFRDPRPRNVDFGRVRKRIAEPRPLGDAGLAGSLGEAYGYLAVTRLPRHEDEFAGVLKALDGMLDRKGIILDLRANVGGDEQRGMELASRFAKNAVIYSAVSVRSGPKPSDLSRSRSKTLSPHAGRRFEGQVVVLVGPGCVSSGEGLAQMMAAIPGVTLVGLPTAGHSGNPQPLYLPNRIEVHFSRWLVELPNRTPLEGKGVPPDIEVAQEGEGDPPLEEAIRLLDAALGGGKR